MSGRLTNPIFIALDVDSAEEAIELVKETRAFVGGFKVGPRLSLRYGETLLKEIARHGSLFMDNKHFDIPNTMEGAVRASFAVGASFCTIHAQCGSEALERLAGVEKELSAQRPFKILAVTVLTSFKQDTLPSLVSKIPISQQVNDLAKAVIGSGLSGLVCSPEEVEGLRSQYPDAFLVTPGIRLGHEDKGDQKRVSDPRTALRSGASAIVVGRPIYEAVEPALAAKMYYEEIQKA